MEEACESASGGTLHFYPAAGKAGFRCCSSDRADVEVIVYCIRGGMHWLGGKEVVPD